MKDGRTRTFKEYKTNAGHKEQTVKKSPKRNSNVQRYTLQVEGIEETNECFSTLFTNTREQFELKQEVKKKKQLNYIERESSRELNIERLVRYNSKLQVRLQPLHSSERHSLEYHGKRDKINRITNPKL
ncbi:Hypothetical predicted protein [Paramuricea clavata]|uniref:Uncharacterized protein n=1 Tax=Paramuricea clavata TaxID=317549 RepID=A0A6S7FS93_PARCT|nr:Hypothetical predicted protein [Paramuricea clavata]